MSTEWIMVEITVPEGTEEQQLDILSGELHALGAEGIELRDQTTPTVVVPAFPAALGDDEIHARVGAALRSADLEEAAWHARRAEPVDWSTHWRQNFEAMQFGRLWVVPTWLSPPDDADLVIRLDPGRAFGTGSHETTALCLKRLLSEPRLSSVLDVGTGSGILSLAALLAGAGRVVGTDNDPDALLVAEENAELNDLSGKLELSDRAPHELGTFDLVVANILWEPLIELAPSISRAVADGGVLLLSGLLSAQVEAVATAYEELGLSRIRVLTEGEWALVELAARS
jgi:ribosomal protein L11 methyltransferase